MIKLKLFRHISIRRLFQISKQTSKLKSAEKDVPYILETDSLKNEQIYKHFGMRTISEQKIDETTNFYILLGG